MEIYNNTNNQTSIEKLTMSENVDHYVSLCNENKPGNDQLNFLSDLWQKIRIENNSDIAYFESYKSILKVTKNNILVIKR